MINEKGITATAKDIKNFNNNKETTELRSELEGFESIKKRMFSVMNVSDEEFDNYSEANNFKYCIVETIKLCKQLHDNEMYETKDWLCGIIGKQHKEKEEKDKEIENLKFIRTNDDKCNH